MKKYKLDDIRSLPEIGKLMGNYLSEDDWEAVGITAPPASGSSYFLWRLVSSSGEPLGHEVSEVPIGGDPMDFLPHYPMKPLAVMYKK